MAKNSFMNQDTRINNNRGVSTVVNNQCRYIYGELFLF